MKRDLGSTAKTRQAIAVKMKKDGYTRSVIAERLGVSVMVVSRYHRMAREAEQREAKEKESKTDG